MTGLIRWMSLTARAVASESRANNVTFLAGSIAYSAFVSMLPLVLLVVLAATIVGDETLTRRVISLADGYLSPRGEGLVAESIRTAAESTGVSLLGVGTLVWGMLRLFRGLDTAFSEVYGTGDTNSLLDQVRDGLLVFGVVSLAIIGAATSEAFIAFFDATPLFDMLGPLTLAAGLSMVFFPMYYVFPNVPISVREAVPGTVVAAIGWAMLQGLFHLYVAYADKTEVYGAIGGALLFIVWLYVGSLVLLVGATTNAVISDEVTLENEPAF